MQCEACRGWSGFVGKVDCINSTSKTARSENLQESWRPDLTAKEDGGGRRGASGGGGGGHLLKRK